MLTIVVPGIELFDEDTEEFSVVGEFTLTLEHSLLSLSKWESKFQKPFLSDKTSKTPEEVAAYIEAMIITPVYPEDFWSRLTSSNLSEINDYINSSYSATTFNELPGRRGPSETITSELIYFWMTNYNIPFACESWHLNRLFALIKISGLKNSNQKQRRMSKNELAQRNREINEQRKARLGTTG